MGKLEGQFKSGEIIETEVKEVVKGGLVVDLGVRGFIPASLIEDYFVESFEEYKGKVISFKIVEIEKEKNRLILSHKAVVEGEKAVSKQQTFESIQKWRYFNRYSSTSSFVRCICRYWWSRWACSYFTNFVMSI